MLWCDDCSRNPVDFLGIHGLCSSCSRRREYVERRDLTETLAAWKELTVDIGGEGGGA